MKRYLDFQCLSCGLIQEDCFTKENVLPCPECGGEMHIVWFKPPRFADPVTIGITKPPEDFQKYVLGRIKNQHKNNTIERNHSIVREI